MLALMEPKVEKNVRVLLLHNFLSPYRVPLFEELATRFDLDVWILGDIRSVRNWPSQHAGAAFRYQMLPRITIPLGSPYNVILLNHTLPGELDRHRHDVIICCGWDTPAAFYTAWHARRAGVPFILWSGSTLAEPTWLRMLTSPMVRRLVKGCSAWLAYGSRARDYLVSLGAQRQRTFLAYNTVETSEFSRACESAMATREALRRQLGITPRNVILYSGNLLDLKGVGDLIEAFALFADVDRDTCLLLAGAGRHETKYRERVRQLGLDTRVVFAGFVQRHDMPQYYALADLLAVPSRKDVWALVVNEALACGVPVAASEAAGASADLIQHGVNGYILPARNPASWRDCFVTHFADAGRRSAMRERARESIRPFSIARAADAFVEAVRCALKDGAR